MAAKFFSKLVASAVLGLTADASVACPYCKVAAGELANELDAPPAVGPIDASNSTTHPATPAPGALPVRFGFATDISNAYFRHGYMQQDRGVIVQPTVSVSLKPIESAGWHISPYFVWFNSIHSEQSPGYAGGHGNHTRIERKYEQYLDKPHAGSIYPHYHTRLVEVIAFDNAGGGWYQTDLKPGIVFTRGPLIIDVNVMGSIYPTDFHDTMIELGVRVSYDLASLWDDRSQAPFTLRLNNAVSHELKDDNGDEETIVETSLEPSYRFKAGEYPVTVSLPVTTGWSPNGYYQDVNTDDETFGFVSVGVRTSVQLPVDPRRGRWFINAGLTWQHLLADSTIFANGGDKDALAASIGIGVAF